MLYPFFFIYSAQSTIMLIFGTLIIMLQRILTGIPNKTYSVEKVQYLWKRALSENRSSKLRTELTANQGYSKCAKTYEIITY